MASEPERWFRQDEVLVKLVDGTEEVLVFQERDAAGLLVLDEHEAVLFIPWQSILYMKQEKEASGGK